MLKKFVKKVFQLVKPFLANLHSSDPQKLYYFFTYEYQNYSEVYADFKSVDIIGKKYKQKKLFAKNFCKLVVQYREGHTPIWTLFLLLTFFLANFSHFSQQF